MHTNKRNAIRLKRERRLGQAKNQRKVWQMSRIDNQLTDDFWAIYTQTLKVHYRKEWKEKKKTDINTLFLTQTNRFVTNCYNFLSLFFCLSVSSAPLGSAPLGNALEKERRWSIKWVWVSSEPALHNVRFRLSDWLTDWPRIQVAASLIDICHTWPAMIIEAKLYVIKIYFYEQWDRLNWRGWIEQSFKGNWHLLHA